MEDTLIDLGLWRPSLNHIFNYDGLQRMQKTVGSRTANAYENWPHYPFAGGVVAPFILRSPDTLEWHQDGNTPHKQGDKLFSGLPNYDFWLVIWSNRFPTEVKNLDDDIIELKIQHIYAMRNALYQHKVPPESLKDPRPRWFIRWWAQQRQAGTQQQIQSM